ncbi:MAG: Nif3-like dinuclear metal center hexameric protein [Planctomycetes bacterium]|nr:Nif3-like dinuclear metal center hexameric protein [Planctomycetota bacterium]
MADARVRDLMASIERIAPLSLAASWDNVGLLAGKPDWPARRILLAIDLTDAVAGEALQGRYEVVVAYHPPICKGIRSITASADSPTSLLPDLLAKKISIMSLHTALDAAVGGTNDVLLDAFELASRRPLDPIISDGREFKLVVFAPHNEIEGLRAALSRAGAGVIGHYSECSFSLDGVGSFRGDDSTNPAIGAKNRLEIAAETRLEMIVPASRVGEAVRAMYATHSYEEPAYDLYPLKNVAGRGEVGMGRIGVLRRPQRGSDLLRRLRSIVDLSTATVAGDLRRRFSSVTAGAGSFPPSAFRDPSSLILTGEMKHHDALALARRGLTAVCLGHYASERPALPNVAARIMKLLPGVRATVSKRDRAPLSAIPRAAK